MLELHVSDAPEQSLLDTHLAWMQKMILQRLKMVKLTYIIKNVMLKQLRVKKVWKIMRVNVDIYCLCCKFNVILNVKSKYSVDYTLPTHAFSTGTSFCKWTFVLFATFALSKCTGIGPSFAFLFQSTVTNTRIACVRCTRAIFIGCTFWCNEDMLFTLFYLFNTQFNNFRISLKTFQCVLKCNDFDITTTRKFTIASS